MTHLICRACGNVVICTSDSIGRITPNYDEVPVRLRHCSYILSNNWLGLKRLRWAQVNHKWHFIWFLLFCTHATNHPQKNMLGTVYDNESTIFRCVVFSQNNEKTSENPQGRTLAVLINVSSFFCQVQISISYIHSLFTVSSLAKNYFSPTVAYFW